MRKSLAIITGVILMLVLLRALTTTSVAQSESEQERILRQLRAASPLPSVPLPPPPKPSPEPPLKTKKAIWAFSIEETDKGMLVRAAIGKTNELTILCDHVDLQTQKSTLAAQGKVAISAEDVQGRCERLTITLHADTVVLDGNAEVWVRRPTHYDGKKDDNEPPPVNLLELRGTQLSLRWPDLQRAANPKPAPTDVPDFKSLVPKPPVNVPPAVIPPPVPFNSPPPQVRSEKVGPPTKE